MGIYTDQLTEVRTAISKVLQAQSYEIQVNGSMRSMTRANLEWLNAREKWLIPLAAREQRRRHGIGITTVIGR